MEPTDIELLQAYACDGDELAFGQLVARHAGWMSAAAQRRLRDDHLADDAVQAVFSILTRKAAQLVGSRRKSMSAWLFHVLHFACVRINRSRARRRRHESNAGELRKGDKADEAIFDQPTLTLLEDTIAQLPAGEREIIIWRFYQGSSFPEIGKAIGISAEAARKRVDRGIARIRKLMIFEGVNILPEDLVEGFKVQTSRVPRIRRAAGTRKRIQTLAKGTIAMVQQTQAVESPVVATEYLVKDVEANLAFFEKLGFKPRWKGVPDESGRLPRASLIGGVGRIWLRREPDGETCPQPNVRSFFWIDGGAKALVEHRQTIVAEGIDPSPIFEDETLANFTVTTPDGYAVGFFTSHR